ncbi:hypothetical protein LTR97_012756 [Elasticomyces elasticus]|uniref:Non-hemolytic phospholipase C n=1 Tax=Elasticomyces elasticus TaxID=574655 RepID=A0AAN7VX44_9PEZI|nr:hypothetical protein LTR97_012756 [Elasticomyces elasticus]
MRFTAAVAFYAATASAGSLKDVKHVVLFMQENRAFDHYFGTMAGVRGFADPNAQVNPDGRSTFQQLVTPAMSNATNQLTPWPLNYLGGNWSQATQCMGAGSNSWQAMHEAYNGGLNNEWAVGNTPCVNPGWPKLFSANMYTRWSVGYFKREDIPTHFDVAEGWTVGDMYQEAVLAATDPNRIVWMSGTVNNPGTPNNPDGNNGGMILDNTASPGCEKPHFNCFPFTWKTVPEYWQAANVSWQVYQDADNFEDNMLAYFQQYQAAASDTNDPLTKYGNSYPGLDKFYADAKAGTLPMISYIIGPAELSEHPPYLPSDGAWLINQVVDAVTQGAAYNETALFISYDEGGGFGDHVTPFHAPSGTAGEWIDDPYGLVGETPVGPGFRIPLFIVSPWTRGGHVFTEHADHGSQILFVEEWLQALGYDNVQSKELPPWRREHMSNLVNAFDFDHPDYSLPSMFHASAPLRDLSQPEPTDGQLGALGGNYIGAARCQATYPDSQPPVPYGTNNANANIAAQTEQGFKQVRGALTEGRYLTFELNGWGLANVGNFLAFLPASRKHDDLKQRWILHQQGDGDSKVFTISSARSGRYIGPLLSLVQQGKAEQFTIQDLGKGNGYSITRGNGKCLKLGPAGQLLQSLGWNGPGFKVFSVTYHS